MSKAGNVTLGIGFLLVLVAGGSYLLGGILVDSFDEDFGPDQEDVLWAGNASSANFTVDLDGFIHIWVTDDDTDVGLLTTAGKDLFRVCEAECHERDGFVLHGRIHDADETGVTVLVDGPGEVLISEYDGEEAEGGIGLALAIMSWIFGAFALLVLLAGIVMRFTGWGVLVEDEQDTRDQTSYPVGIIVGIVYAAILFGILAGPLFSTDVSWVHGLVYMIAGYGMIGVVILLILISSLGGRTTAISADQSPSEEVDISTPIFRKKRFTVIWISYGLILVFLLGISIISRDPGTFIANGAVSLIFIALFVMFGTLTFRLSEAEVRFGFGVKKKTIPVSQIRGVEVEEIRWMRQYGGIGIRRGKDRTWAYIVHGGKGIRITTDQGKSWVTNVDDPEYIVNYIRTAMARS